MKNIILAGAAALSMTASPALSQSTAMGDDDYIMNDEQTVMYDQWPADRQTMYGEWPADVQEYYWTLDPMQTEAWWMLNDRQRVAIYRMTPPQRTQAWTAIGTQLDAARTQGASSNAAMAQSDQTMPGDARSRSMEGSPQFVSNEMVQDTPNDRMTPGEYPPCRGDRQDSCINPREAGLDYGNRPLDYWPGRPASQIDRPLPASQPDNGD